VVLALVFLQLGHRPIEAVLDPALIHEQPIKNPRFPEVLHDPPGLFLGAQLGRLGDNPPLGLVGPDGLGRLLLLSHRVKRGPLQPFGPLQPPREADNPRRQQGFRRSRRGQLLQHLVPEKLKLPRIFSFDDHLLCEETMPDGVLGSNSLALRRARPGRLLGIGTIGGDLGFRSHGDPSESKFSYLLPTTGAAWDKWYNNHSPVSTRKTNKMMLLPIS
jgi:hypothetical protein